MYVCYLSDGMYGGTLWVMVLQTLVLEVFQWTALCSAYHQTSRCCVSALLDVLGAWGTAFYSEPPTKYLH